MACEGLITADILYDCENPPVGGLETDVVLINIEDIDRTASTYDALNKDIITNLQLLPSKTGYLFQGIKQVNTVSSELVKKEFSSDKEKHAFNGTLLNVTAATKQQINILKEGGKYVAVVNRKYKGASSAEAFQVLGFEIGLEIETSTWNSNENDGTLQFVLSSADGFEEPRLPNTLLETDYATTLAAFIEKFAQAAV